MSTPSPLHRLPLCWMGVFILVSVLWAWASSMRVQENVNAGMRPLGIVLRSASGRITVMVHEMPRPVRYFDLYRVRLKPEPAELGGPKWFRRPAYERERYFPYPGSGLAVPLHVFHLPYWCVIVSCLLLSAALLLRRHRKWKARRREILQRALLPIA